MNTFHSSCSFQVMSLLASSCLLEAENTRKKVCEQQKKLQTDDLNSYGVGRTVKSRLIT